MTIDEAKKPSSSSHLNTQIIGNSHAEKDMHGRTQEDVHLNRLGWVEIASPLILAHDAFPKDLLHPPRKALKDANQPRQERGEGQQRRRFSSAAWQCVRRRRPLWEERFLVGWRGAGVHEVGVLHTS